MMKMSKGYTVHTFAQDIAWPCLQLVHALHWSPITIVESGFFGKLYYRPINVKKRKNKLS
jgi:hypothetical protein